MKKIISFVFALVVLLSFITVHAEMEVQIIGTPEGVGEICSLDDIVIGAEAEAPEKFIFKATSFQKEDELYYYMKGWTSTNQSGGQSKKWKYESGYDADYVILRADILNEAKLDVDFVKVSEVVVYYGDGYEFAGWVYQYNYDNTDTSNPSTDGKNRVLDEADNFAIKPMFEGHYAFGCTLPTSVLTSKKPLKMVITIDGQKLTYVIRE